MQDIINKIDERVSGLLAFERHDQVSPNLVLGVCPSIRMGTPDSA